MKARDLARAAAIAACVAWPALPALAQGRPGAPVQGVPIVTNPPAGYPYPNVADSPSPAAAPAAPASAGAPQADPTSQAPNTYGSGGAPPRLNISAEPLDDTQTVRVTGSYLARPVFVSLRALGLYRHDTVAARDRNGNGVSYGGVALQFLPGVATIVRPARGDGAALVSLARATIAVVGSDGRRATFRSDELIDANGDPQVFLVDSRAGLPLTEREGAFRVVSPHDRSESRWIRNVVEIDVNR